MRPFGYHRVRTVDEACRLLREPGSVPMAGGTTLVDLMRLEVMRPNHVIDLSELDELGTFDTSGPILRFGALARMADVAADPTLNRDYSVLAQSLKLAASGQIRNAATLGGNLLQRTRCTYFRDGVSACNKREPGAGCAAIAGASREMAVLGTSDRCIASYPGDWGVALAAFDAFIEVRSAEAIRLVAHRDFHAASNETPEIETTLRPGELVTAILIHPTPCGRNSSYVKVRDRQSYAFALASAAVALDMEDGVVIEARVAVGGVATKPWRSPAAERCLTGRRLDEATLQDAGRAAFVGARPLPDNRFKIELGIRVVAEAVRNASGLQ